MFTTVTTNTPGVSSKLEIFDDDVLLTFYIYTASTDLTVLSERLTDVITDEPGIAPTIFAIDQWMRQVAALFPHTATVSNFRQEVRRTATLLRIELGQGPNDWAAAEMVRATGVVTYFARPETTLSWPRFVRWVGVQREFIDLAREG